MIFWRKIRPRSSAHIATSQAWPRSSAHIATSQAWPRSFRAAAKILDLSPSVVSHHISQLENRLGITLLYRSTRKMSLTQEGEKLYLASKKMLEAAEAGLDAVSGNTEQPSGRLSISIASILGRSGLMDAVASFSVLYPKVKLNIQFSDKRAELIQDGFDMAIRIGTLQDSSLKAKKLFNFERKLVASPSFISGKRKPLKLNDLEEWPWIGLEMLSSTRTFKNTSGKKKSLKFQASIIVDSVDAACQLALAGAGVASPPDFLVQEHLRSGKLVELLPAWKMDPLNVYAVWPQNISNTNLASKFRHELLKLKKNTNAE